jgi:hypothetical protein
VTGPTETREERRRREVGAILRAYNERHRACRHRTGREDDAATDTGADPDRTGDHDEEESSGA